jgi:hypothetical protein
MREALCAVSHFGLDVVAALRKVDYVAFLHLCNLPFAHHFQNT